METKVVFARLVGDQLIVGRLTSQDDQQFSLEHPQVLGLRQVNAQEMAPVMIPFGYPFQTSRQQTFYKHALAIPLEVVPKEIENEWVQLALQAANKSNTILT